MFGQGKPSGVKYAWTQHGDQVHLQGLSCSAHPMLAVLTVSGMQIIATDDGKTQNFYSVKDRGWQNFLGVDAKQLIQGLEAQVAGWVGHPVETASRFHHVPGGIIRPPACAVLCTNLISMMYALDLNRRLTKPRQRFE